MFSNAVLRGFCGGFFTKIQNCNLPNVSNIAFLLFWRHPWRKHCLNFLGWSAQKKIYLLSLQTFEGKHSKIVQKNPTLKTQCKSAIQSNTQHFPIKTLLKKSFEPPKWKKKSRLYWNLMVIMTFKSISFLPPSATLWRLYEREKRNNGWMDCWCIETTEPWKKNSDN